MLREIRNTRKLAGEEGKRWYQDEFFDLFVWHQERRVTRFELRYGKHGAQRTLAWRADAGFTHTRLDSADRNSLRDCAPLARLEDSFDYEGVKQRFLASCREIDFRVTQFVILKLSEYARQLEQQTKEQP